MDALAARNILELERKIQLIMQDVKKGADQEQLESYAKRCDHLKKA